MGVVSDFNPYQSVLPGIYPVQFFNMVRGVYNVCMVLASGNNIKGKAYCSFSECYVCNCFVSYTISGSAIT
uniref:Uncharacterized protein n=1 Tax=viral metagenome TaxID=1070528 RepID=A0A6M3KHH3_9ZZZZ